MVEFSPDGFPSCAHTQVRLHEHSRQRPTLTARCIRQAAHQTAARHGPRRLSPDRMHQPCSPRQPSAPRPRRRWLMGDRLTNDIVPLAVCWRLPVFAIVPTSERSNTGALPLEASRPHDLPLAAQASTADRPRPRSSSPVRQISPASARSSFKFQWEFKLACSSLQATALTNHPRLGPRAQR